MYRIIGYWKIGGALINLAQYHILKWNKKLRVKFCSDAGSETAKSCNYFLVNVSTTERLVIRLRETGRVSDRPRSGLPRLTSRRQVSAIRLSHLRNRRLTATETVLTIVGTHYHPVHPGTKRNRLREAGILTSWPYVGPPLNQERHMLRMASLTAHALRRVSIRQ